jgi:NTE family protein
MKKKVSLVLSGGGARGIAHMGVIEELEKQGYEIASVAGTSMGALVGGVYALGKMQDYKKWMFTLDKLKVFNLVDFSFTTQGLIKGDKLLNTMKEFISDENIEDLKIPFAAVAADLLKKEEKVFTTGSVYDAIRASISIPTVFTPVAAKNSLLVDGGVLNNIPVVHAKRFPDDILIAVNVNANIPLEKPLVSKKINKTIQSKYQKRKMEFQKQLHKINPLNNEDKMGYFELMSKTINLMTYRIAQLSLENNPPDLMINISRESAGTYDFFKAEELVEIGRFSANKKLREFNG